MMQILLSSLLALLFLPAATLAQGTASDQDQTGVPNSIPQVNQVQVSSETVTGGSLMGELGNSGAQIQQQLDNVMGEGSVSLGSLGATDGTRTLQQHVPPGDTTPLPADSFNVTSLSGTWTLDDGTVVRVDYGAYGQMGTGACVACTLDENGGTIRITVTGPDGTVTTLRIDVRDGGQLRFIDAAIEAPITQEGDTLIDGPDVVGEDSREIWSAITANIQMPDRAEEVTYEYRWQTSDGATGTGESLSHRFLTPGSESITLTVTVHYSLRLPDLECEGGAADPNCSDEETVEVQPPEDFVDTLDVEVRDYTPPNLTVTLPDGSVVVSEDPVDAEGEKTPAVVVSGNFLGTSVSAGSYDAIETQPYQLAENDALAVALAASDNGGSATTSWELRLTGAVTGTITDGQGTIPELEANDPIGSVEYTLVARAVDEAGNQTIVTIPILVTDTSVPPVELTLDHPPLDEDTYYDFVFESPILRNLEGEPVEGIPAVQTQFEEAVWAEDVDVADASVGGVSLEAIAVAGAALGEVAEVASIDADPASGKLTVRMRLLRPEPIEVALELRRRFQYQQSVGGGTIEKVEKFVRASGTWTLDPRDITPPRLEVRGLEATHPAFPPRGQLNLVMDEAPEHSEPAPDKQARVEVLGSTGLHPRFEARSGQVRQGLPMTRAGQPFQWTAQLSTMVPGEAGAHVVDEDFFVVEDTPLLLASGEQLVATDNKDGDVSVVVEVVGEGVDLASATSAGLPTPNYDFARTLPGGVASPAGLPEGGARYTIRALATDAAGNSAELVLPVVVVDITPPELQFMLRSQDANELKIWTEEDPKDQDPGSKRVTFLVAGPYLSPANQGRPEFLLETVLGFDVEWPLAWRYGLYAGSDDGDPRNTDPGFGSTVPAELTGAYIPANARVYGRFLWSDNHASASNARFLDEAGLTWRLTEDGRSLAGDNPANFLVRAPNFPPEEYPDGPEYRFEIEGEDLAGNRIELQIPVFFVPKDFTVTQLEYHQRRVQRRPGGE